MGIIARQSIRGTIVTYLGVFVGFLTTFFVLTRFLTTEEIGLARVLIDTATLFIGMAQLGTSSSIIRFFPYFKSNVESGEKRDEIRESHNGFFFWTIAIPFIGFLVFTFLYWALHVPLQHVFQEKSPLFVDYYYAVLPLAFFMLYQTIFETNSNVLMRIVVPRMVRELWLRIFLLAAYLLYAFRIVSLDGLVILICTSYGLAAMLNITYLFLYSHISLRPNFQFVNKNLARKFLLYTLFQITAAIVTIITPTLSSFFITAQMGLSYTGIFAIATYIATMVSIPNRSLNAISNPQLAQSIKDNDRPALQRLLHQVGNNSLLVSGLILCLIWTNIDFIFAILPNGETYAIAKYAVLYLGLSQLIIATFFALLSILNYSRYYYISLLFSLILTVLSILLNNSLIPIYGMNGAAIANLIGYTVYYILLCIIVACLCKVSPFSLSQLKTTIILLVLIALCAATDYLLPQLSLYITTALKIAIWCTAAVAAIAWHISPELNDTLNTLLKKVKK